MRIGINVGDVIIDGDDICGDGVNIAARLEAIGRAGGMAGPASDGLFVASTGLRYLARNW